MFAILIALVLQMEHTSLVVIHVRMHRTIFYILYSIFKAKKATGQTDAIPGAKHEMISAQHAIYINEANQNRRRATWRPVMRRDASKSPASQPVRRACDGATKQQEEDTMLCK